MIRSKDAIKYRDILLEMFPLMMEDLRKSIDSGDTIPEFMQSSSDFLHVLISINMLMKDNWLEELEEVLEEWHSELD